MVGMIRAPLFVPANRPERFAKAAESGADGVILDLEDAVADEAKDAARAGLTLDFWAGPVLVRINAQGVAAHVADLAAVTALRPHAVILPKAEDARAISALAKDMQLPVIALIETAHGLAEARAIAAAPGVQRLAFGSVDFCADMGCEHRRDVLLPFRLELVLASRLAGLAAPLDGVTLRLDDPEAAYDDAAHARALGMGGKLCIHPRQVAPVLQAFQPSAAELAWARRVLAAGEGAVVVEGQMVDAPVRRRAEAILAQATRG